MDMEILLSEQTQGVFLAVNQRQAKHKRTIKKEAYDASGL
jgi:hypothetical protein